MNDGLFDLLKHNAWASRRLLTFCTPLTPAQWNATVDGTYGTIFETMRHYLSSEAGYLRRLSGEEPSWDIEALDATPADFATRIDELDARWMRLLSTPFDAERIFVVRWKDFGARDVPAGVILAQAVHHANEHRSQIATILTQLGVTPPEWGLWDYAQNTDRAPRTVT